MMEWEPMPMEQISTPSHDLPIDADLANWFNQPLPTWPESTTTNSSLPLAATSTKRADPLSPAERNMISSLPSGDVLLGSSDSGNSHHRLANCIEGNSSYRSLVGQLRRHGGEVSTREKVQSIMESIWSQDGRFLEYNEKEGTLSIVSNDKAARWIARDLARGDRRRPTHKQVQLAKDPSRRPVRSKKNQAKKSNSRTNSRTNSRSNKRSKSKNENAKRGGTNTQRSNSNKGTNKPGAKSKKGKRQNRQENGKRVETV